MYEGTRFVATDWKRPESNPRGRQWKGCSGPHRFMSKHQRGRLRLEPPDQFVEVRLARANRADVYGRICALPEAVGDRDRIFVDVQTDEQGRDWPMADLGTPRCDPCEGAALASG